MDPDQKGIMELMAHQANVVRSANQYVIRYFEINSQVFFQDFQILIFYRYSKWNSVTFKMSERMGPWAGGDIKGGREVDES